MTVERVLWAVLATLASGCADAQTDSRAFIDWAAEHSVKAESIDSRLATKSRESLAKSIGSARVVGLGESRHDTREQLLLKALLVRHLIEDLGFRAFILEESFSHVEPLDRFLGSGEGEPRALLNGIVGWYLWDTEEMLDLIVWIRQFNETQQPSQRVRFFGMDITAPAQGVQRVLTALETAGWIPSWMLELWGSSCNRATSGRVPGSGMWRCQSHDAANSGRTTKSWSR